MLEFLSRDFLKKRMNMGQIISVVFEKINQRDVGENIDEEYIIMKSQDRGHSRGSLHSE